MLAADKDALICDFAETYRIIDFWSLPASTAATLACGLREDSRIMRHLSGARLTIDQQLAAIAVDNLRLLVWAQTKDGQHNRNRPSSVYEALTKAPDNPVQAFDSVEDYEKARREILSGG